MGVCCMQVSHRADIIIAGNNQEPKLTREHPKLLICGEEEISVNPQQFTTIKELKKDQSTTNNSDEILINKQEISKVRDKLKVSNSNNELPKSDQELASLQRDQREQLISEIHYLHTVAISCKLGIDKCFQKDKTQVAVLIMLKYMYIESRIRLVQSLISRSDDLAKTSGLELYRKAQLANQISNAMQRKRHILDSDNIADFLNSNKDFIAELENETKDYFLNIKEAEIKVDIIFQKKKNSISNSKRRKYYIGEFSKINIFQ